jgi:hypothetical protein
MGWSGRTCLLIHQICTQPGWRGLFPADALDRVADAKLLKLVTRHTLEYDAALHFKGSELAKPCPCTSLQWHCVLASC